MVNSPLLGHATIKEAVFSVSAVTSQQWIVITCHVFSVDPTDVPIGWLNSDHVICVYYSSMSVFGCISKAVNKLRIIAAEAREQASKEIATGSS
jgi:hypothetical protein